MIELLFPEDILGDYSRSQKKEPLFKTFKVKGQAVFGNKNSQNVTNAGTSYLTNSVGTIIDIKNLIDTHINTQHESVKYLRERFYYCKVEKLTDEYVQRTKIEKFVTEELSCVKNDPYLVLMRNNLIRYKQDPIFRKSVNEIIFEDIDKLEFKNKINPSLLFIVYCIHILKNYHILCGIEETSEEKLTPEQKVAKDYFSLEEEFIKEVVKILKGERDLIDITDTCTGQYRFIDFQLTVHDDVKALPQVLVHLIVDENEVLVSYCQKKAKGLSDNKKQKKAEKNNQNL